jgi:hypothetical protein
MVESGRSNFFFSSVLIIYKCFFFLFIDSETLPSMEEDDDAIYGSLTVGDKDEEIREPTLDGQHQLSDNSTVYNNLCDANVDFADPTLLPDVPGTGTIELARPGASDTVELRRPLTRQESINNDVFLLFWCLFIIVYMCMCIDENC